MIILTMKTHQMKYHFKDFARLKVRELGIDGAVQYFRMEKKKHLENQVFEKAWLHVAIANQSINYIVNQLA